MELENVCASVKKDDTQHPEEVVNSALLEMPQHITATIFSCLQLETISRFCLISREWNALLSSSIFITQWTQTAPKQPWLLIKVSPTDCQAYSFLTKKWRHISLPFHKSVARHRTCTYSGAGLGLLLVEALEDPHGLRRLVICNPLTKDIRMLPPFKNPECLLPYGAVLVGKRDSYKVIRVWHHKPEIEIYDSSENAWTLLKGLIYPKFGAIDLAYCDGVLFMIVQTRYKKRNKKAFLITWNIEDYNTPMALTCVSLPVIDPLGEWDRDVFARLVVCGSSILLIAVEATLRGNLVKMDIWKLGRNAQSSDAFWNKITSLPERMCWYNFINVRINGSVYIFFECAVVGDYICVGGSKIRKEEKNQIAAYDMKNQTWSWMDSVPFTTWNEPDRFGFGNCCVGFEPNPYMKC